MVIMVTTVTNKTNEVETGGASIVWYGGIFLGAIIILVGVVWLMTINNIISLSKTSLFALLIIIIGMGITVGSIWIRKVILASMN